jgi:hypothetical protein
VFCFWATTSGLTPAFCACSWACASTATGKQAHTGTSQHTQALHYRLDGARGPGAPAYARGGHTPSCAPCVCAHAPRARGQTAERTLGSLGSDTR